MRVMNENEGSAINKKDVPDSGARLSLKIDYRDDDMQMNEMNIKDCTDGDGDDQSKLSFRMKEKLHTLTGDIRRRTSQMVDEIMRELDDDCEKDSEDIGARKEHRPSLMSLIGLQRAISPVNDEGTNKSRSYLWRIFLSSINPLRLFTNIIFIAINKLNCSFLTFR
ncbi:unnamed protein product [Onchocerca ochengi]|uniref:t-SNARE coiled-coil homology domain-containing protein n=1 Tax=Onchocerca ochengi TaxID=42157 RepID=A0A182ENR8_ONCOC|nr:unnamed protein product [Onchocerca ochengi]